VPLLQPLPLRGFRHLLAIVNPYNPWTRGPVRAHPRLCKFATDPWIGTPNLLQSQATSHSHTFTCRHLTFLLSSQCPGVMVLLLLKVTWVTLEGDQASPLPLRGRPNI
jgi:hypothetical protein